MKTNQGSVKIIVLIISIIVVGVIAFNSYKSRAKDKELMDLADKKIGVMMEDGILLNENKIDNNKKDDSVSDIISLDGMSGSYRVYDESLVSSDYKSKILFFNASWCPICKTTDKELKSASLPDDVLIMSVDYDKYTDLKKKYEVTYQHTFVLVDSDGEMIKKWSGGGLSGIKKNI